MEQSLICLLIYFSLNNQRQTKYPRLCFNKLNLSCAEVIGGAGGEPSLRFVSVPLADGGEAGHRATRHHPLGVAWFGTRHQRYQTCKHCFPCLLESLLPCPGAPGLAGLGTGTWAQHQVYSFPDGMGARWALVCGSEEQSYCGHCPAPLLCKHSQSDASQGGGRRLSDMVFTWNNPAADALGSANQFFFCRDRYFSKGWYKLYRQSSFYAPINGTWTRQICWCSLSLQGQISRLPLASASLQFRLCP